MIAEAKDFQRCGHFTYLPMPGGAAAIKKPWRMAVSGLYDAIRDEIFEMGLPFLSSIPVERLKVVIDMIEKGVNSPLTSSCGRLFDAVAAISGIRNNVAYEGQAAVELEAVADEDRKRIYPIEVETIDGVEHFRTRAIIRAVVEDVTNGVGPGLISATFHNTLVQLFLGVCQRLRARHGLDRVVLSGGCFQNARLLVQLFQALEKNHFEVYSQSVVPSNDGGIALGQAMVADAKFNAGMVSKT